MASMSSCSRCAILLPHLLTEEYDPFPPGLPSNALRDSFNFSGFGRSKLPILVDEHNALILNMDHHVWFAIAIHVLERQGDRRYILPIAKQNRSEIDHGMRTVPARTLDHLHVTVQIDGNKMARTRGRVVVSNDGICLECARPTIVPVILGDLPPGEEHTSHNPQRKHRQHPNPEIEQPMTAGSGRFFYNVRLYILPLSELFWRWLRCSLFWWQPRMQHILPIPLPDHHRLCRWQRLVASCAGGHTSRPHLIIVLFLLVHHLLICQQLLLPLLLFCLCCVLMG